MCALNTERKLNRTNSSTPLFFGDISIFSIRARVASAASRAFHLVSSIGFTTSRAWTASRTM
jgi:hypothetical protein